MTLKKLLVVACALGAGLVMAAETQTSFELSYATYRQKVDRVEVVVGSQIAAIAAHEKYIPLQIAVGVSGRGPELQIAAERFVLIDSQGNILNAVPEADIAKDPAILNYAKEFTEQNPLQTGDDFSMSNRVASNFYPLEGGDFYTITNLDRETYLEDLVFFPRPEAGLEGVLTLQLLVPGMDKPVELRFEVPEKKKKQVKKNP